MHITSWHVKTFLLFHNVCEPQRKHVSSNVNGKPAHIPDLLWWWGKHLWIRHISAVHARSAHRAYVALRRFFYTKYGSLIVKNSLFPIGKALYMFLRGWDKQCLRRWAGVRSRSAGVVSSDWTQVRFNILILFLKLRSGTGRFQRLIKGDLKMLRHYSPFGKHWLACLGIDCRFRRCEL